VTGEGDTGGFCSGTLINPRVFLTAATARLRWPLFVNRFIEHVYVSFDADPLSRRDDARSRNIVTHPSAG
jgi:hypothetical protein